MPEDLSRLIKGLREEKCPPRVLAEVERRISQSAPRRLRLTLPFAVAALVLAACLSVWQNRIDQKAPQQAKRVARPEPSPAQIARQTENSLGLMGRALLDAGAQSEKIISAQAVPPLRDGLKTARNKIIQHIDL